MSGEPEIPFESASPVAHFPSPLPSSADAESSLLGCCLIDGTIAPDLCISRGVSPTAFTTPANRVIWEVIQELRRQSQTAEPQVVAATLQTQGRLTGELISLLATLIAQSSTTAATNSLIDAVLIMERRRDAMHAARLLLAAAEDPTSEIDEALRDAHRRTTPPTARGLKPFQLWTPAQFIAHAPDPSACLLGDGFIEKGEWTSLIGVGGLGKTRLALHFAISQILGRPFCGIPTKGDPQQTVILSTENGLRRWKSDIEKFYAGLEEPDQHRLEANLRIQALLAADDADLNLGIPETVLRLKATLSSTPQPGLVIFDPFADMVDGDENKTTDVVQTLQTFRRLTSQACPDAAILIIHHSRTGAANVAQAGDNYNAGNFGRGSKALFSKVRCELQLAPQDRDDPNRLVLACGKANNTEKFSTRGLIFNPETFAYSVDSAFDVDDWRADVAGTRKKPAISISEVVSAVSEKISFSGSEITTKEIADLFSEDGVSFRTIQRLIVNACELGYLRKGKKRSVWLLGNKPLPK